VSKHCYKLPVQLLKLLPQLLLLAAAAAAAEKYEFALGQSPEGFADP
jgi:hypothetical protein